MYIGLFAVLCSLLQVFIVYSKYVSVLKWLTLALFAYFGTALVVNVPWAEAGRGFFIPTFDNRLEFWTTVVAIFGTTISPYLFFLAGLRGGRRDRRGQSSKAPDKIT